MHKDRNSQININSNVDKTDYPNISPASCFPISFLPPKQCPCLCHLLHDIKRVQVYNESWSALKNRHSQYSRSATGQNLEKAMEGNTLNLSLLRAGLPGLSNHWDAAFQHMHKFGGTRYELAVRPRIKNRKLP